MVIGRESSLIPVGYHSDLLSPRHWYITCIAAAASLATRPTNQWRTLAKAGGQEVSWKKVHYRGHLFGRFQLEDFIID